MDLGPSTSNALTRKYPPSPTDIRKDWETLFCAFCCPPLALGLIFNELNPPPRHTDGGGAMGLAVRTVCAGGCGVCVFQIRQQVRSYYGANNRTMCCPNARMEDACLCITCPCFMIAQDYFMLRR
eukprot:PhF_6_TR8811/c0_g1_i1/m.13993